MAGRHRLVGESVCASDTAQWLQTELAFAYYNISVPGHVAHTSFSLMYRNMGGGGESLKFEYLTAAPMSGNNEWSESTISS